MHLTDTIEVTLKTSAHKPRKFLVSAALGRKLEALLQRELKTASAAKKDFIPAAAVFPEAFDALQGPAMALRGLRQRESLTQRQLAEMLGIRQHHLSEMENAKRPIGKVMARKLAEALGADRRVFL